jgi:hypothetical protein
MIDDKPNEPANSDPAPEPQVDSSVLGYFQHSDDRPFETRERKE